MTILGISVLLIMAVLVYIVINLFTKLEYLERNYISLLEKVNFTIYTMRIIDDRQMFENDDEVGIVFKQLTEAMNELSRFIEKDEET